MLLRPEADPAVLLAWVENEMDLANVHRAARVREDVFFVILVNCVSQQRFERYSCVHKLFQNMWGRSRIWASEQKKIEASGSLVSSRLKLRILCFVRIFSAHTCFWEEPMRISHILVVFFFVVKWQLQHNSEPGVCQWILEEGTDPGVTIIAQLLYTDQAGVYSRLCTSSILVSWTLWRPSIWR